MVYSDIATLPFKQYKTKTIELKVTLEKKITIAAVLFLLVVLSVRVWTRSKITEYGYKIASAQEETVKLSLEENELELAKSMLTRQDILGVKARELDLNLPSSKQIIRFNK